MSRHYLRSKLPPLCLRRGSHKWTEEILQWIVHSLAHPDTPFSFQWPSYRVRIILDKQNIDVLAINETRLDDNISDLEVNVRGCDIIRRDRPLNVLGVRCDPRDIFVNPKEGRRDFSVSVSSGGRGRARVDVWALG